MKVRELMSSPAITVGPDATFHEVVDVLLTNEISGVPVVDASGQLLGMITEADLVAKDAYGYRRRRALGLITDYLRGHDPQWVRKSSGRRARDLMTAAAATASPEDEVAVAARHMLENQHKRVPVVEDGRVIGVVSRHDLLRPFHRSDADLQAEIEALLADMMRVPESHEASASVSGGVVTLEGTTRWPSDAAIIATVVGRVPGVVGVDNGLVARESEPTVWKDVGGRPG
jgi:CBS domain-containing protein